MINLARVKRGTYFDSITLMKLARALSAMEGVADAAAVMATPANLQLLADAGLAPFVGQLEEPRSNDVLMVARASDEGHATAALEAAERLLLRTTHNTTTHGTDERHHAQQPRSLEEAGRAQTQANIAVISVPGMYAALEVQQALRAGLHVFLFSDNVSLKDEVALKRLGAERRLLVMGPDCGTARLYGVGLGFVNVVPDGPIGLVGASGTGMQQVMCLLAQAGYGISQAIGCGGRDLSAEVGGATTLQGLRLLQEDEQTRVIVLISKPPAPEVAEAVLAEAANGQKPVVVAFIGANSIAWQSQAASNIFIASNLTKAAQMAGSLYTLLTTNQPPGGQVQEPSESSYTTPTLASTIELPEAQLSLPMRANLHLVDRAPTGTQAAYLAALFSGGTLCEEALHIWDDQLGPVYSNIPLRSAWLWREGQTQLGHYALDLGSDEYTRGRPHPMIDPEARLKYLRTAANDPLIGVILLDIVLGYCAHPDPASIYVPLIQESIQQASKTGRTLNYVISLCGTEGDPQRLSQQEARLREAGAETYTSNAEAAARCLALLREQQA